MRIIIASSSLYFAKRKTKDNLMGILSCRVVCGFLLCILFCDFLRVFYWGGGSCLWLFAQTWNAGKIFSYGIRLVRFITICLPRRKTTVINFVYWFTKPSLTQGHICSAPLLSNACKANTMNIHQCEEYH